MAPKRRTTRFTTSLAARNANTMASTAINSGSSAGRNERAHSWYTYRLHEVSTINFKHRRRFFRIDSIDEKMETTELKKKMTDKYCLKTEIKKLKVELWELKVKGTDVIGYNQRFQELALLYGRMFLEESDKIEKYVSGLPDMIHKSVVASKPKTMQEATEMAIKVMDKRICTFVDRQTESKRKFEDTSRNTQNQPQQNKRQNTGRGYTARTGEKKPYGGSKPLCAKCNYHHDDPCAPKCHKCNKVGHFARDCRSTVNANNANNQRGTRSGQRPTCFECGAQGHFKRECPKLKNNNNHGDQGGNGRLKRRGNNNRGFLKIAKPMNQSPLNQEKPFEWVTNKKQTVLLLKQKYEYAPIPTFTEGSEDFIVYCDASIKGLGTVLMKREKRRWLELLSDYDCEIRYHPGKSNVVADALSRKEREAKAYH
ncbi:reverse transcriptase domain-containing protein [Tanacetum coccineum]